MGNYRCYNCNKEFWREGSLKKHFFIDCPKITEEMKTEALKPYRRIVIRFEDVIPGIDKDKEIFKESRMIDTQGHYGYAERILQVSRDMISFLSDKQSLESGKH